MKYVDGYDEFFNLNEELKNYPLYKGVSEDVFRRIMKDYLIKSTLNKKTKDNDSLLGVFDSPLRWNVAGKVPIISATRNFDTAKRYGAVIFEFDMLKLSSRFKIIPFCENPDYYLDYMKLNKGCEGGGDESLKKILRDKKYGKLFWKIKTDRGHFDYGICEELIIAEEIDIRKYVKKIYLRHHNILSSDVTDKLEGYGIEIKNLD
jgi:hypothetical protein